MNFLLPRFLCQWLFSICLTAEGLWINKYKSSSKYGPAGKAAFMPTFTEGALWACRASIEPTIKFHGRQRCRVMVGEDTERIYGGVECQSMPLLKDVKHH